MVKRVLLVVLNVFLVQIPSARIGSMGAVHLAGLLLQVRFRPFAGENDGAQENRLEILQLTALSFLSFLLACDPSEKSVPVAVLSTILVFTVLAVLVVSFVRAKARLLTTTKTPAQR